MGWQTYASFLGFAVLLVLMPGPDFVVVARNVLASGRRRGAWAGAGVATSNAVQGSVATLGLGAVIVASQPVFRAIEWAGAAPGGPGCAGPAVRDAGRVPAGRHRNG